MGSSYTHVFEPLTIKGVEFQNRIVCTPHVWGYGSREGIITPEQAAQYERIAAGSPGLLTLGNCSIQMKECSDELNQIDLGTDASIFGLSTLRQRVRRYGTVLSAQVNYCGRNSWWPGSVQYAPSPITAPGSLERADLMGVRPEPVYEMSKEKIYQVIDWYADAAERLQRAGFKMLMLHYAHNNLPGQFFSPISNFRDDEYGPMTLETRTRFGREVLEAVRRRVGNDMIIDLRFSGEDVMPGGLQQDEAIEIAKILEPMVDIFTISCAFHNAPSYIGAQTTLSYYSPQLTLKEYTKPFRAALKDSKLVLTTSVVDLDNAEEVLEEGIADFVGMMSPFLADPDIVKKYARNKPEEVRPCIRCQYHWSFAADCKPVPCAVNPLCGHAYEFPGDELPAAKDPKKVLVVGAGPAGMQAALTASERGHAVTLVEKEDHLGGNLVKAANVAVKSEFKKYLTWLLPRVESSVDVVLNTEVDADYVARLDPDVLILAVGSEDVVPPLAGIDASNVHFAWQADSGSVDVGENVVVIGAGLVGIETASQLAHEGKNVTVVEMLSEAAVAPQRGMLGAPAVAYANEAGVTTLYETCVDKIEGNTVVAHSAQTGDVVELPADTVLLAAGVKPRRNTVTALRHSIAEGDVYLVGDLVEGGGTIGHATNTAFDVAVVI